MKSFVPVKQEYTGQLKVAGETSDIKEVPHTPLNKPKSISPGIVEQTKGTDPIGTFAREQEAIRGQQTEVNLERPTGLEEDPHARKDRPGDHNPSNYQTKSPIQLVQSSYVEKISSATSAVAGKAISATNVVASKLGYEEKDDAKEREMHQRQDKAKAASPMEYGKRIVTNVAERLSPAYEKVAETGSTVMSKVHGTRAGTGFEVERKANKQDRRVSVKDYVAEKLKPGEEDGALSELISEALHKKKRGEEAIGKYGREFWRTCGSKFCARSWSAMVDKVKGVVGSLFGKGVETRASQHSLDSSAGN
ncbi:hypothetical protein GH714_040149 [Hevea brasiliensis]|uniref:Uncharacterized protein n=1 Tax=Hevea brasiliensis TaxID=3981 RepID=A0A6A6MTX3_HEVBR|nr:hypothetical protein GH714_040149 [Hevea brasiliensis]